jgi:hypothetical protein
MYPFLKQDKKVKMSILIQINQNIIKILSKEDGKRTRFNVNSQQISIMLKCYCIIVSMNEPSDINLIGKKSSIHNTKIIL